MTDADFDSLPRFDARDFEPPAWASSSKFSWGKEKNGESSKPKASPFDAPFNSNNDDAHSVDDVHDQDDDDAEEVWEDASEGHSVLDLKETTFTTEELQEAFSLAQQLKTKGNASFVSKPPDHQAAIKSYRAAIAILPPCPKKEPVTEPKPTVPPLADGQSGIQEVTEDEAVAIEAESQKASQIEEEQKTDREKVEEEIRGLTKACWGNLAACYIALNEDKQAVDACTEALKIDPHYVKALHRRAIVNDKLATWSSLTSAQEDYNLLVKLLPSASPVRIAARRALLTLPDRLRIQQEKEKDEMLGKLKELGNGLLGKFGLNTDMFKFDQQEGGGYNMRFER